MKKVTIKALHDSIDHWFDILGDNTLNCGWRECALCDRFGIETCSKGGEKCPVYKRSGYLGCDHTPHPHAIPLMDSSIKSTKRIAVVREEINFLISLLPKKEQRPYWYD